MATAEEMAGLLEAVGARHFVTALVNDPDDWSRPELTDAQWEHMVDVVDEIDAVTEAHGLQQVVHPHVATLVETADELERFLAASDVPFCLDTGHVTIGGADALDLADAPRRSSRARPPEGRAHRRRRPALPRRARAHGGRAGGVFAPLGDGDVPVADVIIALERQGYDGLYVLEQDVAITGAEPPVGDGPVRDVAKSVAYLRSLEPALRALGGNERGIGRHDNHRPEGEPFMTTKLGRTVGAAAALTLVLAACTGGDDDNADTTSAPATSGAATTGGGAETTAGGRATTGGSEATTGDTEATTGGTEATTGDTEATTGGSEATTPGDTVEVVQGEDLVFHVITHGDDGVFWSVVQTATEAAAADYGVTVNYIGSNNDAEAQSQAIEAAIAEGSDGIAISLADPEGVSAAAQAVVEAGIPLYTLNSGLNNWQDLGAITHVGQDEIVAGQGAGERFNELGVTKILCGRQEQTNVALEERCEGLAETFEGEVVSEFVGLDADPTEQENQIAALLQADPAIDAFMGTGPEPAAAGHRRRASRPDVSCRSPASTSRPT